MTAQGFDTDLFLALNFDGGSFLDRVMWLFSDKVVWIPLYLLLLFLVWRRLGWRYMLVILVATAVGVGVSDQICNYFKNTFQMLRPNRVPEISDLVHSVINPRKGTYYIGGSYGTISAHAATTMSIFLVVGHAFKKERLYWIFMPLWVLSVCYSRIYLGVHFPSQILFGLVTGAIIGFLITRLLIRYFDKYKRPRQSGPCARG